VPAARPKLAKPEKTKKSAATEQRHAHGVDSGLKAKNLARLRRIEGQLRGLQRMVEEDRYCPDVLVQVASAQEALRGVARELMKNHLHHCARQAFSGSDEQAEQAIDEILTVWTKHAR
jgi:DNA-binding FrmR family transcriptional regulator